MAAAEGFQRHLQLHPGLAVNIDKLVVVQFDDVAIELGHQVGDAQQFSGAVGELHGKGENAPPVDQPVLHQRGDGNHVHIAAGQHAYHVFPPGLQMGQGGDGEQSRVFHHHFVLLHHVQESVHQLVVVDGEDAVHILPDIGEHLVPRGLHRHAVGDGGHFIQRDHVPGLQAGLHGCRPGGLYADHPHRGVEQLGQGRHARGQPAAPNGH